MQNNNYFFNIARIFFFGRQAAFLFVVRRQKESRSPSSLDEQFLGCGGRRGGLPLLYSCKQPGLYHKCRHIAIVPTVYNHAVGTDLENPHPTVDT